MKQQRITVIPAPEVSGIRFFMPSAPVAGDWWNPDGSIACANIYTYQARAAASYAASLVNLVNPGVNDLAEGNGAVPWDAVNGWGFVAAAAKYFITGLIPVNDQSWSMLVQFANHTAGFYLAASRAAGGQFALVNNIAGNVVNYRNGGNLSVAPALATGNLGVAGSSGYRNGVADAGVIGAWTGVSNQDTYIGARNNLGAPDGWATADIYATAIYDCTLTAPQVALVAAAMAAL